MEVINFFIIFAPNNNFMTLNSVLNSYRKGTNSIENYIGVTKQEKLMGPYKKVNVQILQIDENGHSDTLLTVEKIDNVPNDEVDKFKEKAELQALEDFFKMMN